jgi:hypothetical protein
MADPVGERGRSTVLLWALRCSALLVVTSGVIDLVGGAAIRWGVFEVVAGGVFAALLWRQHRSASRGEDA